MFFYVVDAWLEFALQIMRHECNSHRGNVLRDMEEVYVEHTNKEPLPST